jgi:hypothetical protein
MVEHQWKREADGEVDVFAHDVEFEGGGHNGPRCTVCDLFFCQHCQPKAWRFECPGPAPAGKEWDWTGDATSAGRPPVPELR